MLGPRFEIAIARVILKHNFFAAQNENKKIARMKFRNVVEVGLVSSQNLKSL